VDATGFERSRRLLTGSQFQQVFRRPVRSSDDCFSVAGRRRVDADPGSLPRLGLAVSRKALPRAVDRNRVKRLVREMFRHTRFPCAIDLVVVARAGLKQADNARVRASITRHFSELAQNLCRQRPEGERRSLPPIEPPQPASARSAQAPY
jgi:ribonuclease P protein component